MKILGIETTCDETCAAVVEDGPRLLGQVILSQAKRHAPFGGVVPEIASRSHVENLSRVVDRCLEEAEVEPSALDGIAVAHRPGLIGALLVGVTTAKALAWSWRLPLIGVNHLEAHLEAPFLSGERVEPPFLGVVLSGGHTDLYHITDSGRERVGNTLDDALGEAFDKVASILGLPYPGGPEIERKAAQGNPSAVRLPRSLLAEGSLDFSFSGIKTAVLYMWRGQDGRATGPVEGAPALEDICAAFQAAVFEVIAVKIARALERFELDTVILGGGVTANSALRLYLEEKLATRARLVFPSPQFATDNAAMIAAVGLRRLLAGEEDPLTLEAEAQP